MAPSHGIHLLHGIQFESPHTRPTYLTTRAQPRFKKLGVSNPSFLLVPTNVQLRPTTAVKGVEGRAIVSGVPFPAD